MAERIRTFIAFDLPADIADHAARLQSDLKARGLRLRWVRPQNIHLTLKFLGDIPRTDAAAVAEAIERASLGTAPLELMVQGLGVFPGIKRPRVLWIGLGGQIELLQLLHANIENELAQLGFAREKRGFNAHLTLARFRQGSSPPDLPQAIEALGAYAPKPFAGRRLVLYQSDLRPQGAVYTPLREVRLDCL